MEFEHRYNATARPFRWKYTSADLDDLLARIDRHTQDDHALAASPPDELTVSTT